MKNAFCKMYVTFVGDCGNAFLNTLQSVFERKTDYGNKAGECNCHGLCGRDAKILYRLCHERYHFQGTSGCPRWLKPVQRRTLYDMYELGIRYDRPYRKCARIVGDTMVNTTLTGTALFMKHWL